MVETRKRLAGWTLGLALGCAPAFFGEAKTLQRATRWSGSSAVSSAAGDTQEERLRDAAEAVPPVEDIAGAISNLRLSRPKVPSQNASGATANARRLNESFERKGIRFPGSGYEPLAALFEKGTAPSKEDVTGWFAGITYEQKAPNDSPARPSLFVGMDMEGSSGRAFKLDEIWGGSPLALESYDHPTPEQLAGLKAGLLKRAASTTAPKFGARGVSFEYHHTDKTKDNYCEVRKLGGFLIMAYTTNENPLDTSYTVYTRVGRK